MMEARDSAIRPSPLRRPQEREEYRKSLYKSSPTSWRATYAKRCRERLKESRGKFLERYRAISNESNKSPSPAASPTVNLIHGDSAESAVSSSSSVYPGPSQAISNEAIKSSIQEVMRREWENMREEHTSLPELPYGRAHQREWPRRGEWFDDDDDDVMEQGFDVASSDVEYVVSIMDQLTQELVEEEKTILSQYSQQLYEENQRFSETMLSAAVADSMTSHEVVCPICQKNFLQQNLHIIFCACGLRIDTAQDCITLDFVRQQLEDCTTLHCSMCNGKPVFSFETTLGTQNIIMNCSQCDFMYIVV